MSLLSIDSLAEGMTLAEDIHDRSGRLLLSKDNALTARHIRMFMTWGINEVDIVGDNILSCVKYSDVLDDIRLKTAEDELKPFFSNVNLNHPVMAELLRLCVARKVEYENS